MQVYRAAGCCGVLNCSAKSVLKCLLANPYPLLSLSTRAFSSQTKSPAASSALVTTGHPSNPTEPDTDIPSRWPGSAYSSSTDDSDLAPDPGPEQDLLEAQPSTVDFFPSTFNATSASTPSTTSQASQPPPLAPGLYVIPTPIGNLRDLTLRAADTLRGVSLLLAEDTRHTRKLLNYLGIRHVEMLSCHEHNEGLRVTRVLQRLQLGEAVGLVSDAGMPGISDPGHAVVAAAVAAGLPVVALPGPCALVTALVGSGLPTSSFTFLGFLPAKSGTRRRALERVAAAPDTLVLYVPPHGLAGVLGDAAAVLGGERRCCVAREVSKVHEEYFRSTLDGALKEFSVVREARGEIVLMVEGAAAEDGGSWGPGVPGSEAEAGRGGDVGGAAGGGGGGGGGVKGNGGGGVELVLRELLEAGTPVSAAVKEVVTNLGANKKAAYALALRLREQLTTQQLTSQSQRTEDTEQGGRDT